MGIRFAAGALTFGLLAWTGGLGTGVAQADTAYVVGGARGPGVPWYDYTNRAGRGFFPDVPRVIVPYPAGMIYGTLPDQLFPGKGLGTDSVGDSVSAGTQTLAKDVRDNPGPAQAIGLSEGTLVLDALQAKLAADPKAPPPDQLQFNVFSDPLRTHAFGRSVMGMFTPGTYLPVVDYTVPAPVDSQYHTNVVVAEYDGAADFPDGIPNIVSYANAAVGALTVHTPAAFIKPGDVPPQNVVTTTNARGGTTTTYLVPTPQLPLTQPLREMGMPADWVNQLDAMLRPEVDSGYTRHGSPPAPQVTIDPATEAAVDKAVAEMSSMMPKLN